MSSNQTKGNNTVSVPTKKVKSINPGCVMSMRVPVCKAQGNFYIQVFATANVSDEEIETIGWYDWADDSDCMCKWCRHEGTVLDFRKEGTSNTQLKKLVSMLKTVRDRLTNEQTN